MIFTISNETIYLIEGTINQSHQYQIDYQCEPSYTKLFFINWTIRPLYTNKSPKNPTTTIGFSHLWHNPSTKTIYHAPPFNQRLQHHFQPAVTGCQDIEDNTKIIPLLRKLTLKYVTLIS